MVTCQQGKHTVPNSESCQQKEKSMLADCNEDTHLDKHLPHALVFIRASVLPLFNADGDFGGACCHITWLVVIQRDLRVSI